MVTIDNKPWFALDNYLCVVGYATHIDSHWPTNINFKHKKSAFVYYTAICDMFNKLYSFRGARTGSNVINWYI